MPLTLSFILVSAFRAAFNYPSELHGNWAFQLSEAVHVGEYVAATRKWIVVCAILPLFALMSPIEFACFRPAVAMFHLAFGIALSMTLAEILFFGFRKVPFTCSYLPGKVNFTGLAVIYVFGFTWYSDLMSGVEFWLSGRPAPAIAFLALMGVCLTASARWRAHRVNRTALLEYEDASDPAVRTLDLVVR